eukprot:1500889-Pyramimonas_sp.AAC.1
MPSKHFMGVPGKSLGNGLPASPRVSGFGRYQFSRPKGLLAPGGLLALRVLDAAKWATNTS